MAKKINVPVRIDGDNKGYKNAAKGAEEATKKMARNVKSTSKGMVDSFKKLGAAIGITFALTAIINFGKELIKLASKAEGVTTAFKRLGSPALLKDLQKATRGTVSDLVLMQKAVQAKNFKIPLEQLATYFEFATKRAIQTGESVDYLVESIITGIGRKSVLVMDNLGISAVELQQEVKKVGDFGLAAGNIIRREIGSMGDVADTSTIKIAQVTTALENMKVAWGELITNSTWFAQILDNIATRFKTWADPDLSFMEKITWSPNEYKEWLSQKAEVEKFFGIISGKGAFKDAAAFPTFKGKAEKDAPVSDPLKKALKTIQDYVTEIKAANVEAGKQAEAWRLIHKEILGGRGATAVPISNLNIPTFGGKIETDKKTLVGGPTPDFKLMIHGLDESQEALIGLSETFASFFSDVNLGFEGMIDGVITGIKRLVMELIAKAAFLAILSTIFPGAGVSLNLKTILGGNASKLIGSGGGSSGGSSKGLAGNGNLNINVTGKIHGRDIYLSNERYGQVLNNNT
ncbi:MAG TPA: hypothetical protein VMV86_06165 [Methanosarcinales archaeon]|nr:hypothetical protein [Methanosarcinales archaeon]